MNDLFSQYTIKEWNAINYHHSTYFSKNRKYNPGKKWWSKGLLAGKTLKRYYDRDILEDFVPANFRPVKLNQRKSDKIDAWI